MILTRIWLQLFVIVLLLLVVAVTITLVPGSADVEGIQAHIAFSTSIVTVSVFLSAISTVQGIVLSLAVTIFAQHLVRVCIERARVRNERMRGLLSILDVTVAGHLEPLFDVRNLNGLLTALGFFGLLLLVRVGDVVVQSSVIQGTGLYPFEIKVDTANLFSLAPGMLQIDNIASFNTFPPGIGPSGLFKSQLTQGLLDSFVGCNSTETCGLNVNGSAALVSCPIGFTNCTYNLGLFLDYHMECKSSSSNSLTTNHIWSNEYDFNSSVSGLEDNPKTAWVVQLNTLNSRVLVNTSCNIYPAITNRTENSDFGTVDKKVTQVIRDWSFSKDVTDSKTLVQLENGTTNSWSALFPIWQVPEFGNMTNQSAMYNTLYSGECLGRPSILCLRNILFSSLNELAETRPSSNGADSGSSLAMALQVTDTARRQNNNASRLETNMRFLVERAYKRVLAASLAPGLNSTGVPCRRCGYTRMTWTNKNFLVGVVVAMNGLGIVLMLVSISITVLWDLPYRKVRVIEVIKSYEKVGVLKEEAAMADLEMQATLSRLNRSRHSAGYLEIRE
ncbi:hypothetical protein BC830DRAFT_1130838 [Chytriomyces sp. MP71]|nr:hypothetical protein BC830DRAFT_1130838 [Chytriomyces sp. MP71]